MTLPVAERAVEEALSCVADARIVIATDFSEAAVPLTLMRAFVAILGGDAAAEIILAVPGEPSDEDANSAQMLLSEAGAAIRGSVRVESFETAASQPYDVAVVPQGDLATLFAETGDAIVRMHVLAGREQGNCPGDVNAGRPEALARLLENYEEASELIVD